MPQRLSNGIKIIPQYDVLQKTKLNFGHAFYILVAMTRWSHGSF
jgi:hypothetical protein